MKTLRGGSVPKEKPPLKPDDADQSRRFVETARELEADETGEAFEGAIDSLVNPAGAPDSSK
jgi:hypothetical protein